MSLDWEAISAVTDLVGAFAVVCSLVYVGF